jgi:hypothetical protein
MNRSVAPASCVGSHQSLPPLHMVATYGYMTTIGNQQEGEATYDDETLTAFAGMTGQANVLDVEDMEVLVFGDGDGAY